MCALAYMQICVWYILNGLIRHFQGVFLSARRRDLQRSLEFCQDIFNGLFHKKEYVVAPVASVMRTRVVRRVWRAGQGWIWRLVPCRGGAKVTPADQYRRRSSASIAFEPPTFSYFVSKSNAVWSRPFGGSYFQANLLRGLIFWYTEYIHWKTHVNFLHELLGSLGIF